MEWILVLIALIIAITVLFYQLRTGVPPFPSTKAERQQVLKLLEQVEIPAGATIYELGSGWGGLARDLADAYPQATVVGIELSPFPYWVSKLRTRGRANLKLLRGDFHKLSLDDADVVTAYLMIKPMQPLAEKLDRELKKGAAVVTVAFLMRHRQPSSIVPGEGLLQGATALYHWPARN